MIVIDDLLGIPYRIHGTDKTGFDCYGLAREVCRRLGRELPDFKEGEDARDMAARMNVEKVEAPEFGDILLFSDSRGRTNHIGIYLKNDDFIHCDCYGVRITKLSLYCKKYEVFRWQE